MKESCVLKMSAVMRNIKGGLPSLNTAFGKTPLLGDILSTALEKGSE